MLNIFPTVEDGKALVALEGRLDTVTAPELDETLKGLFESIDELTFDFGKLEYISSAGLRVLISAHKVMLRKGGMKLTNVNESVMEILSVTGFSDILTIE